ncbi:beta-ketoacyl-[acyl-carrier-protein] synthase family protein [Tabrizicola oligotrophica]|uniref:Nodulation protein E n=1 Tax=Tabrizicola oligotrophica TaxID=2710650 RepID=A0A6M0QNJ3_9RHOB|nr:beta-ketoacyl-[acyl-carrier-protein] synthase family protein [Tabrizicola oligotrophica]NEY88969.1 beta-ketoacyl-[acyl-carrier-protein] synthase family protein [Tabrizicola oligotrophica]
MRRVVITGAGTVNPLGQDVASSFRALRDGVSAIAALQIADLDRLSVKIGAQVADWQPENHFDRAQLGLLDRHVQFALAAARQAGAQARLTADPGRTAVIMGTAGGGLITSDEAFRAVYAEGRNRVHPFTVPRLMASAAASHISMDLGLTGPAFSVSSACASSNHAIGLAFQMVRSGMVEAAFAGGSEAMLSFGGLKAWEGLRVMAPDACRPFSLGRNGMVQGEGAAVFVLEPREAALARGAGILAEIVGFAMTSDASDIVLPNSDGAARAMAGALADAGLEPGAVDHINAHGTGTAANDRSEAQAIARVFGDRDVPLTSTKSLHGHLIGAAGAVELLAVLLALQEGIIAPTAGYLGPDPDCPVDLVTGAARQADVAVALSNAFAFGGLNAVLALARA